MTRKEIEEKVLSCIRRVAEEQAIALPPIEQHLRIVENLGFKSLDVATLTAFLETAFGVDPFAENMAVITEIRTVSDVCDVYDRCVNGTAPSARAVEEKSDDVRLQRRLGRKAG